MSLVIMNDQLSNELAHVVLEKLQAKLKVAIDHHLEGRDRHERIADICNEIANVSRQAKPKQATVHEVNF